MITFLDILSFVFSIAYGFVFFWMLKTFLRLRDNKFVKILGFVLFLPLADCIIYSNDLPGILGAMMGFFVYLLVFYQGTLIEKGSVLLIFYPALIAINYLTQDIGAQFFHLAASIDYGEEIVWNHNLHLISTGIHTASLLIRLFFWIGAWRILRKSLSQITSHLTLRMWLIVDMLVLASFVAIFTIIYFMPEDPAIVYPICGASIFSSFGCIYLASYICNSVQIAYRAQELEMQHSYYTDRLKEEERVRSIYHDLKNHLLVLESQAGHSQDTQSSLLSLQSQIEGYEAYHHTGNDFLDILLRDKSRIAREKQIDISASAHFQDSTFLDPLDISTIFGNALDNAIEASVKLPPPQRLITLKARRVRNMLAATIENNMAADVPIAGKTSKKDVLVHGFGLPNIKKAVEKYGGQCTTRAEDGTFTLKILIPIP